MIKIGDNLPKVNFKLTTSTSISDSSSEDFFKGRTVVLFGLPGAFTPVCSSEHVPGFTSNIEQLKGKGIDAIACLSVNDAFVMQAWGRDLQTDGKVEMIADGNGDFTRLLGLEMDGKPFGLGMRSQRFSMLVRDGIVEQLSIEESAGQCSITSAESILQSV